MEKQEIIDFLKEHGRAIGKKGFENDCPVCLNIMRHYKMLKKCQDGLTWVLLEQEIERYKTIIN